MAMTRKQQRFALVIGALVILGVAAALVLTALRDSIVFFYTPAEVMEKLASKEITPGRRIRLGGLVARGTVKKGDDARVEFIVTDTDKTMRVSYKGVLPDLFREGQGVVAEGVLMADGPLKADTVLAKHDENYMPREVAESLKKKGYWQENKLEKQKRELTQ